MAIDIIDAGDNALLRRDHEEIFNFEQ